MFMYVEYGNLIGLGNSSQYSTPILYGLRLNVTGISSLRYYTSFYQILRSIHNCPILLWNNLLHPYSHHTCNKYRIKTMARSGLCASITQELAVIPEAEPKDNCQRLSYFSA